MRGRHREVQEERPARRLGRPPPQVPDDLLGEHREAVALVPRFQQGAGHARDLRGPIEGRVRAGEDRAVASQEARRGDRVADHAEELVEPPGVGPSAIGRVKSTRAGKSLPSAAERPAVDRGPGPAEVPLAERRGRVAVLPRRAGRVSRPGSIRAGSQGFKHAEFQAGPPGISARQQGVPGRRADRRRRMGVGEPPALPREPIDVGGRRLRAGVVAVRVAESEVIGEEDDDIGR